MFSGRERSRPMSSILDEISRLSEQGVNEITLLGQNVNSYCDETSVTPSLDNDLSNTNVVNGFSSVYKTRRYGLKFVDLLEKASSIAPNIRFRFTSPHPKDFPLPLLNLIKLRKNICKQIHLPVQSGSNLVLERMRRGYTVDSYLDLIHHIRQIIPQVTLSSDFICGFVGESEEDHQRTLNLIQTVGYDMAYMYAYSMREKTMAHRRYTDDIPEETKQRRLREMADLFYLNLNSLSERFLNSRQLVLIEGPSKKDKTRFQGRTDGNKSVILDSEHNFLSPGQFIEVLITGQSKSSLIGKFIKLSSISEFD